MKVNNISRACAINYPEYVDPTKTVWITIQEPEKEHVKSQNLGRCPTLEIDFWDVTQVVQGFELGQYFYPPSEYDAKKIVDFLVEHQGKDVIVNCKMGISRSGAISPFCQDYLGYEWDADGQQRAVPNQLLYKLMAEYYGKPKKIKVNDKSKR